MDTSVYQSIKLFVLSHVNLSNDAIHMHIGLAVFFLSVLIRKKGRFEILCLLPVMVVAMSMEALDLFDDLRSRGHMRWSASMHDMMNTVLWPVLITAAVRLRIYRRRGE